ncbi:O-antigen ligase family protein [Tenacibaculum sp. MAR_2009_124]|uniref:O-antigen ligase family protein n=1 Tax=Tenacibaculum sp. MAR_2009_124 TaxID=1250059 RepID=UPI0015A235FC|nr:O-antigen ligase family protein [Tenacibaculum sp. MAR_2009_124]
MAILFVAFLTSILKNRQKGLFSKQDIIILTTLATLPILFLVSTVYSENISKAIEFIVRTLPLILLPVSIIGLGKMYGKVNVRTFSLVYLLAIFFNTVFNEIRIYSSNNKELTNWEYRQIFEELTGVHGTYYSLWISIAILMITFIVINEIKRRNFKKTILFLFIAVYLIYYQTILGARMPFIISVSLILIHLLYLLRKKKLVYLITIVIIGLFILILVKAKSNLYERIGELTEYNLELPEGDYHIKQGRITNTQIRNGIYYCSFLVIKQNFLFGIGIGDVQDELQKCYQSEINSNVYDIFTFNTHNQYLLVLASNGVLGLIFFLGSLIYLFKIARENRLYLYFFLVVLSCFLTENILSRHDGVVFYALFNSVLISSCLNEKSFST